MGGQAWGVVIVNKVVREGLSEQVMKYEGDTNAERKEFLSLCPPIANQSFFNLTFFFLHR